FLEVIAPECENGSGIVHNLVASFPDLLTMQPMASAPSEKKHREILVCHVLRELLWIESQAPVPQTAEAAAWLRSELKKLASDAGLDPGDVDSIPLEKPADT